MWTSADAVSGPTSQLVVSFAQPNENPSGLVKIGIHTLRHTKYMMMQHSNGNENRA